MVHIFSPLAGLSGRTRAATAILALALTLGGCASIPPPDDSMNLAQNQLQAARDADAADYAPVDLGFAQDKFQQAQAAMAQRKYADAANLADESRADAELARAKARLASARAQIQAKVQENTQLRQKGEQQADAPAEDSSTAAPVGEMPAPSASVLSAPMSSGEGFQTVPSDQQNRHPDPDAQGGQP